jgi:putative oxygen-independent coproporphyrinogen III oxidase
MSDPSGQDSFFTPQTPGTVVRKQIPGLYIHVPFCMTKCPYCDFYSVTDRGGVEGWLDALGIEMDAYGPMFHVFDSLYLGGGTPSLLDERSLTRIFTGIHRHWRLAEDTEITIEANPDDITGDKLRVYRSLGVNRLSLGVQSFADKDLAFLKRRHGSKGACGALEMVRRSGFDNLGIDLIYGLKGQTRAAWRENLERALSFEPTHLSCYQLTLESRTPFGKLMEQGALKPLKESSARRFFLDTSLVLESRGFLHYEISNFARSEAHMSRHNGKYWNHTPYLGLGPGAHSFSGGKRWWNYRSVDEYCEKLKKGTTPVEGFEILTPGQKRLERLYFGFRTRNGLPVSELGAGEQTLKRIETLKKLGLITLQEGRVVPTREGFLVADSLPLMFSE